jgi:flagellar protein FlgJ
MDLGNLNQQKFDLANNANDVAGLDKLRLAAKSGDEGALQQAAEQFEAVFIRMMLKSMRQAQDVLADENSPMNTEYMKFYRDMHDQQIANDLASGDGMGLAELIVQQLGPQQESFTPASVIRNDGNLPFVENAPVEKNAAFESEQAFIDGIRPAVEPVADKLGLEPNALIAQAALETGWGQHMVHDVLGQSSNNLFGIKVDKEWKGAQAKVPTLEFTDGVAKRQHQVFKVYDSIEDSLHDYYSFLQKERYQPARDATSSPDVYFSELQKAGYATDPMYADKVTSIMQRIGE